MEPNRNDWAVKTLHDLVADRLEHADLAARAALLRIPLDNIDRWLATGGYKAETAILYGLGCGLGIRVYYLHETYRVPIALPFCAVPFWPQIRIHKSEFLNRESP